MPIDVDETRFGSGKSGLLCGYLFQLNQPGELIDAVQAETLLTGDGVTGTKSFVWLHLNSANKAADRWLSQVMALPAAFKTALQYPNPTRVDWSDGALVAVLSDVTMNERDVFGLSSLVLLADRPVLVSVRSTPLRSIERLRQAVKD